MSYSAKSTIVVVTSMAAILVGAGATLVVAQQAADPNVDPAPSTTITGQPTGPGHPIRPNTRSFSPDAAESSPSPGTTDTGPADVGGHWISP